jgi:arylsulfatase A-like enzyme
MKWTIKRVAWIVGLWAGFSMLSAVEASNRPNILVILVDDMGYSDLGCYGSEIQTPHLDRLAAEGIRYTQMYNTSKCWTTRISLLTGLWHTRSGRGFEHSALVSEVLGPAGYRTWWSGKHHASFNPHGRGFDHFSGFLGGAISFWNPSGKARPNEPAPKWKANYRWAFDKKEVQPYVPDKDFYATDRFTDWAMEWLDDSKDDDKPFFLYVAYNAPHWPLHARQEDIAKYKGVYEKGYAPIRHARYARQIKMGLFDPKVAPLSDPEFGQAEWAALSDEERQIQTMRMTIHAAMVDRVDQNVGRLVSKLKQQKRLDNTLILFLVDNGASAEQPGNKGASTEPWGSVGTFQAIGKRWAQVADTPLRFWKVTSHEGGICTPMIAHWPAGIAKAGEFYRQPCHLVDLLPTFMELAGEKAKYPGTSKEAGIPPLDGLSIAPSFEGKSLKRKTPLFFQYGRGKAIRDGDWKLVRSGSGGWELYNLRQDRTETRNLASSEPDRVIQMTEAWEAWYESTTGHGFVEKKLKKNKPKKPKKTKSK